MIFYNVSCAPTIRPILLAEFKLCVIPGGNGSKGLLPLIKFKGE